MAVDDMKKTILEETEAPIVTATENQEAEMLPLVVPSTVDNAGDEESPEEPYLASDMYKRIITLINRFESELPETMQAGGRLVSSGNITFSIQDVGFWDPNMIVFYGELSDGSAVELVQHLSQLNLLLVAVPRKNPSQPRRIIGFNNKNEPDIVKEDDDIDDDTPDISGCGVPLPEEQDELEEDDDD